MKRITRNNINKMNMVALSYCQAQTALDLFGTDYKIGYNAGVYGWNYDLYRIGGVDVVTGYNVPYYKYSNNNLKNKLIELENKIRKEKRSLTFSEYEKKLQQLKKEFFEIFK